MIEFEDQRDFDEQFEAIVGAEQSLDSVLELLDLLGVKVEPWQRRVVADWVSGVGGDTRLPMRNRVAFLRTLLRAMK